jgi:dienelactone hydrolase
MQIIFVAGPYRASTKEGISHNIATARRHAERLWKEGYAVLCPHLNSAHMDGLADDQAFLDGDLAMLRRCDVIYMLPKWKESEGAREEHRMAKKWCKEIIYASETLTGD